MIALKLHNPLSPTTGKNAYKCGDSGDWRTHQSTNRQVLQYQILAATSTQSFRACRNPNNDSQNKRRKDIIHNEASRRPSRDGQEGPSCEEGEPDTANKISVAVR